MVNAKDKKEFLSVLRVISEEAVRISRKSLNETPDPYLRKYEQQFSNDQKKYGSLSEQEDAPEEEVETEDELGDLAEPAEDAPDEDIELEDDMPPEEDAEVDGVNTSTEEFGVSFDSVLDAINNLRAGKSLKDTNIKDQTSAYYDRLDDPERKVLLIFLKQLSGILGGALEGSAAKDPSDMNLTITDASAEDESVEPDSEVPEEEVITDEEPSGEAPSIEDEAPEEDLAVDEEDTAPPIKVNESQDMEDLRRRVRRLMLKG